MEWILVLAILFAILFVRALNCRDSYEYTAGREAIKRFRTRLDKNGGDVQKTIEDFRSGVEQ